MQITKKITELGRETFYLNGSGIIKNIRFTSELNRIGLLSNMKVDLKIDGNYIVENFLGFPSGTPIDTHNFIKKSIVFNQDTKFEVETTALIRDLIEFFEQDLYIIFDYIGSKTDLRGE